MKLYIVGTGAGNAGGMTLDAQSAIQASDIVVGYTLYVELLRSIFPEKNYLSTGMKSEAERVNLALSEAQNGKTVAPVSNSMDIASQPLILSSQMVLFSVFI